MISDHENGGLKMMDIKLFSKALKSSLMFDLQLRAFGGVKLFFEVIFK